MKPDYLQTQSGTACSALEETPEKHIFFWVLLCGFTLQMILQSVAFDRMDYPMWASQIQYFLTDDHRMFDLYAAYGHPGTPLVELGILFHILFGFSYGTSLTLSMSILIALATAVCSVFCFLLYPQTLWWLATACILILNRMYIHSTPPTTVVMPFTVLIVLATWWLLKHPARIPRWWPYFLWGAVVGLAAATRLDASLLVGAPLFALLWYRHGYRVLLPIVLGSGISFFIYDPFLWFMPLQHITDLTHKFSRHYLKFNYSVSSEIIQPADMVNAVWLSAISFGWALVLFFYRRLERIVPGPIIVIFSGISIAAMIVVFSSKFQALRYFFPLLVIWEVFLPLFVMETVEPGNPTTSSKSIFQHSSLSSWIIVLVVLTQLLAYSVLIIYIK